MDNHSEAITAHAPAGHDAHADDMPFAPEEIEALHSQDKAAATAVVGLMLFIFGVGVVLYTIVAITVAT